MAPAYDLHVDIPERPKGDKIEVPPFGTVENGGTLEDVEMSRDDAEKFKDAHGIEIKMSSQRKTAADERAEQEAESLSTIADAPQNEGSEAFRAAVDPDADVETADPESTEDDEGGGE